MLERAQSALADDVGLSQQNLSVVMRGRRPRLSLVRCHHCPAQVVEGHQGAEVPTPRGRQIFLPMSVAGMSRHYLLVPSRH